MTVLEYLQSLDLETRVAVVGCADNALRGIRNLDEQTAAAASFGLWACPDYLAQQLGLAFNCNYPASADAKRCTRCAAAFLRRKMQKIQTDVTAKANKVSTDAAKVEGYAKAAQYLIGYNKKNILTVFLYEE